MNQEPGNIDETIRQMAKDDVVSVPELLEETYPELDKLELMSPRDYAASRDLLPQQVYYYIRQGVVVKVACLCGRTVIDARQADSALARRRRERQGGQVADQ